LSGKVRENEFCKVVGTLVIFVAVWQNSSLDFAVWYSVVRNLGLILGLASGFGIQFSENLGLILGLASGFGL